MICSFPQVSEITIKLDYVDTIFQKKLDYPVQYFSINIYTH